LVYLTNKGCAQVHDDYTDQRAKMIENQIKSRGVKDFKILSAMKAIKRELFVPEEYKNFSYSDRPLPIGYSQTISQPYIVAYMTENLDVKSNHRVLEIGTGSGYQAAVLSKLVDYVYTIEIIKPLAEKAENVLKENNYTNVTVKIGDGYQGWEEEAPFDRIMVTAAPKTIPNTLIDQLKNGGRMIIPVGQNSSSQHLWIIEKDNEGNIKEKKTLPVRFVPMVNK